jgi:hypothetical protein
MSYIQKNVNNQFFTLTPPTNSTTEGINPKNTVQYLLMYSMLYAIAYMLFYSLTCGKQDSRKVRITNSSVIIDCILTTNDFYYHIVVL